MAELTLGTDGAPKVSGDGIYAYLENPSLPAVEVYRVRSSVSGDYIYSKRFQRIKGWQVQNHGATFATGVSRDPPKVVVTQGTSAGTNAKVEIVHTATAEFFSIILWGEL